MTGILRSSLGMIDNQTVAGYVADESRPGVQFVVEILVDDIPVGSVRADNFSPSLFAGERGDAHHGFVLAIATPLLATSRYITARLANIGTAVGDRIDLEQHPRPDSSLASQGAVENVEWPTVKGWIRGPENGAALVRAEIGGEEIAATVARIWTSRQIGGKARAVLSFELRLPDAIADGESHLVDVITSGGNALLGSPVRVDTAIR